MKKIWEDILYKNVVIGKNRYGFYYAFLWNAGYYMQCDTLKMMKKAIREDLSKKEVKNGN